MTDISSLKAGGYLFVTKKQTRFLLIYEEFSMGFPRFATRKPIFPSL
ncbi:hypothetical protein NT05LM_0743 [Listeria marthii FSL S4-120]|uniref:Uncharacterized protein n=1 Tax=Listeria marthii FSL S4-120 TaxID=702457 RepID=A0ABN0BZN1_9LIST|nr:hypothetical protein NT05LM_0743 [Listeria marthii FSL S4-120]